MKFTEQYRAQITSVLATLDLTGVETAINWLREARDLDRTIFLCGNGGSASTASHFACDILKGASFGKERRFRIMALTDSVPTLTAYSNDICYSCVFEEQLRNFAQRGDVVMAISGSGNSPNVVRAIECARERECKTIGLTGRDGGKLAAAAELNIHVNHPHMGRIEDVHLVVCHMIAYAFMEE